VAVITGAASGIGKAIAIRCGKAGMKVILVDVVRPHDDACSNEINACGGFLHLKYATYLIHPRWRHLRHELLPFMVHQLSL